MRAYRADVSPDSDATLRALRVLLDEGHLSTPDTLPAVLAAAAATLGWQAQVYVTDYEQQVLVPVPSGSGTGPELAIDTTLAGRAFQRVEPFPLAGTDVGMWLPLLDGTDRLGVVRLTMPAGTDLEDPVVRECARLLVNLTGHLIAAKSSYGDGLDHLARLRHRTVPSELLWDMLPPRTFGCRGLVLSGILQPCYGVAADAFDYSVVHGVAHLAVLDATGHDLRGTLLSAVALAALRNSRREGRTLYETAQAIDEIVDLQGRREAFVTGLLGQLDLRSGRLRYLNAGHPAPLLMRRGHVVKQLDQGRRILFGLGDGQAEVAEEWLEPDDWVVFYTDGITEARDASGAFFGLERLTDVLERSAAAALPAPETLRRASHAAMEHQNGILQDDATLLVAHWASGEEQGHTAT